MKEPSLPSSLQGLNIHLLSPQMSSFLRTPLKIIWTAILVINCLWVQLLFERCFLLLWKRKSRVFILFQGNIWTPNSKSCPHSWGHITYPVGTEGLTIHNPVMNSYLQPHWQSQALCVLDTSQILIWSHMMNGLSRYFKLWIFKSQLQLTFLLPFMSCGAFFNSALLTAYTIIPSFPDDS